MGDLRIAESGRDDTLDEIVDLAARVCGTSMAAISIVGFDRQWFRTQRGFSTPETDRDRSLCAHAILSDVLFVVEDAHTDPRVDDSVLVTGDPHVRLYAAAPLVSADGHAVGTLCVLDTEPGTIEPWQGRMLEVLARQAMAHLRLDCLVGDGNEVADELGDAQRNLDFLATHDSLTSLLNRQAITDMIDGLATSNAAGTSSSAVLHIDLDDFRHINEVHGHVAGDRVLVTIADRIHLGARGDDAVGRLASDEFVVLIPNAMSMGPETLAQRLLQAIAVPVEFDDMEIMVTASIGLARWSTDMLSAGDLLRASSAAMHDAKSDGGSQVHGFEIHETDTVRRQSDVNAFVRRIVTAGALRLEFQPQWSLSSGALVAHEALLRWNSDHRFDLTPGEFVAAAEDLGLVSEITEYTIREACRVAAVHRSTGDESASITVNLSAMQLERDEVILTVASALNDFGLDPSALVIDLTESTKLATSGPGQATLRELHNMGIRIALDDFGTGFASLDLVRALPFDFMKIHGSFVAAQSDVDREVLRSLIQLGHSLGMTVVAEGIEEPAVLEQLGLLGCDLAQGYLLGRPSPFELIKASGFHPLITALHQQY
ncbi:MAG: EAL domain-containing protein [Ilumatobacteraceae bacterium]